jgi:hypothetical protein
LWWRVSDIEQRLRLPNLRDNFDIKPIPFKKRFKKNNSIQIINTNYQYVMIKKIFEDWTYEDIEEVFNIRLIKKRRFGARVAERPI